MGGVYDELARKMEEGKIVKVVTGDYVVYRRDWLQEHIEQEYTLIKSVNDIIAIKNIDFNKLKATRESLREFLRDQKGNE